MSDYLSDEEQVARLRSWWSEKGTLVLLAVVLAVALAVGWRWYQSDRQAKTQAGSDIYAEFVDAPADTRQALAAELEAAAAGTAYPVLAKLALAQRALEEQSPEAAIPILESALALAKEPELADLIQLRLAKVAQAQGDSQSALGALGKVRSTGYRSLVAELKGDIHLSRGERADAHEAYAAALAAVSDGERRPLLALKVSTTAADLESVIEPSTASAPDSEQSANDADSTEVLEPAEAEAETAAETAIETADDAAIEPQGSANDG